MMYGLSAVDASQQLRIG
jgi:hypothetical protein